MGINYYILDLETTGLSAKDHEVCEISIIRVADKVQLSKNIKCLKPEKASLDALRITGKKIGDLLNGDDKYSVVNLCNKFFKEDGAKPSGRCIVGHNIAFDRRFSHALWEEFNKEFPAELWLDTRPLYKAYLSKLNLESKDHKLVTACEVLGVKKYAAHTASGDTRNNFLLFQKLIEQIEPLEYIKNVKHIL